MSTLRASVLVNATPSDVFHTVAHIENLSRAIPEIVGYEVYSNRTAGVGARYAEIRQVRRREVYTELEVVHYEPAERVRIQSRQGGNNWDVTYLVTPVDSRTKISLIIDLRPATLLARLTRVRVERRAEYEMRQDLARLAQFFRLPSLRTAESLSMG